MAMPNTADIALQLDNFIKDVQTRVDTWPVFQAEFKTRGPELAKDRKLQIYEACLNKLSSDQRAQLEHILNEMIKALPGVQRTVAKSVFQVHGVDANGVVVIRRQLKRRYVLAFFEKLPSCLVGIEACASSHHWSRELRALGHNPLSVWNSAFQLACCVAIAPFGAASSLWSSH
jgi:hypothetical protein